MPFLERLARFCYRQRWMVLLLWILLLGAVVFLSRTQGGRYVNNFSLPGTESQRTFDLLKQSFPAQSGDTGQIVFKADKGIASVRARMEAGFEAARAASRHVVDVTSPYSAEGARQVARATGSAGKIAFGEIQFDIPADKLPESTSNDIQQAVKAAVKPGGGLQVEFGGPAFQTIAPPGGREERIGLAAAVLILLLGFGSVLAMGLSMFTALFSLGVELSGLVLLARAMDVVTFAPLLAAMIGLGVGIDYALFIVTRYRQGLQAGKPPMEAVIASIATAGRAVLFAGVTVIISLMGMFLMGLSFINGLAVGSGLAVAVTMVAAVTLLPALMGFTGDNIDKLSIHRRRDGRAKPVEAGFWFRWSRQIQRHPLPYALICLLVLGALASPVLRIRLGNQDAGNGPTALTTRRAYDLLSRAFGPGYNGPLLVAARFGSVRDLPALQALAGRLAADSGVAAVSPIIPNDPADPTAAIMQVYGRYAPQDLRTDELVTRLRKDVIGPTARSTGIDLHSGGAAAIGIDLTDKLTGRLPFFFGAVILLSFLLLMSAFRSVLVPLKAAIMNVIAIGAAFGVLVAVFQWGWGARLIGVDRTGPIAAFSPMLLFAILFGLSMDYEVFLLSRIKEEHDRTGNNAIAVADGLASTARVITAAAAIMVTVFFSFVLGDEPTAKLVGLGLAVSVLLDATLVRMVLVPATMELLGEANWWLPRWLDRLLPRIHIEASKAGSPAREEPLAQASGPQAPDLEAALEDVAVPKASLAGSRPAYPTARTRPLDPDVPHYAAYSAATGATSGEKPSRESPMGGIPLKDAASGPVKPQDRQRAGLAELLLELPFKAGTGSLEGNLMELAQAALEHYKDGGAGHPLDLTISRLGGYLLLEQRFGRIGAGRSPDHAAQLLIGAVALRGLRLHASGANQTGADGDTDQQFASEAVRMILEGIEQRA